MEQTNLTKEQKTEIRAQINDAVECDEFIIPTETYLTYNVYDQPVTVSVEVVKEMVMDAVETILNGVIDVETGNVSAAYKARDKFDAMEAKYETWFNAERYRFNFDYFRGMIKVIIMMATEVYDCPTCGHQEMYEVELTTIDYNNHHRHYVCPCCAEMLGHQAVRMTEVKTYIKTYEVPSNAVYTTEEIIRLWIEAAEAA